MHHRCWRGRFAFREETAASGKRDGTTGHRERAQRCPGCCDRDHPTQAIFHNHRGDFTPAQPRNLLPEQSSCPSPPCTAAPWGKWSPFPFPAARARHVPRAAVTPSTGHGLPSSGQPRSAKVSALRESQAGSSPSLAAAGCQEGQHQQHRSSRAWPESNRQWAPGAHNATGPACPDPRDSSADGASTPRAQVGAGLHPADFELLKLLLYFYKTRNI